MTKLKYTAVFLIFSIAGFISCSTSKKKSSSKKYLARYGKHYLTKKEAQKQIPGYLLNREKRRALKNYRNKWVKRQMLMDEAKRLNISQKKGVKQKLRDARQQVLLQQLEEYVKSTNKDSSISNKEARNYYQKHKDKFTLDERYVRFHHLQTRSYKKARSARQQLLKGKKWLAVARKFDLNPASAIQNSRNFFPISMALNNIRVMHRYLTVMGPHEISPIKRLNGIYHFVQLIDTKAKGEQPDLKWLINQIKDWMKLDKQQRHFSSFKKNLYLQAKSDDKIELYDLSPEQAKKQIKKDTLDQ